MNAIAIEKGCVSAVFFYESTILTSKLTLLYFATIISLPPMLIVIVFPNQFKDEVPS